MQILITYVCAKVPVKKAQHPYSPLIFLVAAEQLTNNFGLHQVLSMSLTLFRAISVRR